jgi:pectinesterase
VVVRAGARGRERRLRYLKEPDAWFASDGARAVAANVPSYKSESCAGGQERGRHRVAAHAGVDRARDLKPTFDSVATTGEQRFLVWACAATRDDRYRAAFLKGLDRVPVAQYTAGGWPQSYPPDAT